MGQPSGGWRKSEGDEKKREGALERERELEGCVRRGRVSWEISVCVNRVGVSVLCLRGAVYVCSRVGQPRLRCQRTVQLSCSGTLLNTLMSYTHAYTHIPTWVLSWTLQTHIKLAFKYECAQHISYSQHGPTNNF